MASSRAAVRLTVGGAMSLQEFRARSRASASRQPAQWAGLYLSMATLGFALALWLALV